MSEKDLRSIGDRTIEEQQEITRKGGIASGKGRAKKRDMKAVAKALLESRIDPGVSKKLRKQFPDLGKEISMTEAILASVGLRAIEKGDPKAAEFVRDTAGQKPIDKQAFTDTDGNPVSPVVIVDDIT